MVLKKTGRGMWTGLSTFSFWSQFWGTRRGFRHSNKSRKLCLKLRNSASIHVAQCSVCCSEHRWVSSLTPRAQEQILICVLDTTVRGTDGDLSDESVAPVLVTSHRLYTHTHTHRHTHTHIHTHTHSFRVIRNTHFLGKLEQKLFWKYTTL
jgi:hypothetical protein